MASERTFAGHVSRIADRKIPIEHARPAPLMERNRVQGCAIGTALEPMHVTGQSLDDFRVKNIS